MNALGFDLGASASNRAYHPHKQSDLERKYGDVGESATADGAKTRLGGQYPKWSWPPSRNTARSACRPNPKGPGHFGAGQRSPKGGKAASGIAPFGRLVQRQKSLRPTSPCVRGAFVSGAGTQRDRGKADRHRGVAAITAARRSRPKMRAALPKPNNWPRLSATHDPALEESRAWRWPPPKLRSRELGSAREVIHGLTSNQKEDL